jgi:hypothetical protein
LIYNPAMLKRIDTILGLSLTLVLFAYLLPASSPRPGTALDRARAFTRSQEFNYEVWTYDAVWLKLQQSALGLPQYIQREDQVALVMESVRLTESILQAGYQLQLIYTDPNIKDKEQASVHLRAEIAKLFARQHQVQPIAESVIQGQATQMLSEQGLTLLGQPTPPVLYHVSPLPMNLVISRRDKIEQINAVSLQPDIALEDQIKIEDDVAGAMDASTLIVPVGGIGAYPTMVMRTEYFEWQVGTVVHEWTHNFLSLRPLGVNYGTTPELRIINETTASIVENEIGPLLLKRYYPTFGASSLDPSTTRSGQRFGRAAWTSLRLPPFSTKMGREKEGGDDPPPFDFRAEMHTTPASTQTSCWLTERSKKPKPTWKRAVNSFGITATPSANSTRPTSRSTALTPMSLAARRAKTLSAQPSAPCASKANRWRISSTPSRG